MVAELLYGEGEAIAVETKGGECLNSYSIGVLPPLRIGETEIRRLLTGVNGLEEAGGLGV